MVRHDGLMDLNVGPSPSLWSLTGEERAHGSGVGQYDAGSCGGQIALALWNGRLHAPPAYDETDDAPPVYIRPLSLASSR